MKQEEKLTTGVDSLTVALEKNQQEARWARELVYLLGGKSYPMRRRANPPDLFPVIGLTGNT